ncbi:MAG TPA: tRNA (adenosine(37)-N6)-threonylcarbamoyltransferase complex ATPase subunit type 1 TsaE [Candidatus Omnitrophota bacterium]|nr:tRNA (adenosine(37)-N6)-threonylcarbamoyltransferase complex ATPase subunit type 1 TsaE [Candidatus Omnitrophota bacterium]
MITKSAEETMRLGKALAQHLKPGSIVCLHGELGSGKTTLVKGLAQGLKLKPEAVNSPTFVLMNVYEGKLPLYHFDFYRLENPKEIEQIGYEEFLYGNGVSVVEWADKLQELYPKEFLKIELAHVSTNERRLECSAQGNKYEKILSSLKEFVRS